MNKLTYIAPEIEVLEITIEKGFAQTNQPAHLNDFGYGGW